MMQRKNDHPLPDVTIPAMERWPVAVRAYVVDPSERRDLKQARKQKNFRPEWILFFDTETTIDPAQRLRFGAYEIWKLSELKEKGLFYGSGAVTKAEKRGLEKFARADGYKLRTVADFIENVFYRIGYHRRGMIVGFNLPFDISRLAIDHATARGRGGREMRDAFTLKLSPNKWNPRIRIEHLSSRNAFTRFTGRAGQSNARSERKRGDRSAYWRGAFVDVKTIGAALTGRSHSLDSLAQLLGVGQKMKHHNLGAPIDAGLIRYCIQDVRVTRNCFIKLQTQYDEHGFIATPINKIYSEASLGKAYFEHMGLAQRLTQGCPNWLIGAMMASYYGGRSEVRCRRSVRSGVYCDFLSMYPTICTNMGLWSFMTADGFTWRESADEVRELLKNLQLTALQKREFWRRLATLVLVEPNADLFPVRAQYAGDTQYNAGDPQYTIGLNYLTSKTPFWFTLADCINTTILSGRPPRIIRALTFTPRGVQPRLRPVSIMGKEEFRIDPRIHDFPKRLIELRVSVKQKMRGASDAERAQFDADQLGLKILASAISYGVFMELNAENLSEAKTFECFGADTIGFPIRSKKIERSGRYFHPLLGTLITGAARLMLAIAERLVIDAGLDPLLCDIDSMMIGQPPGMADEEFHRRAKAVRDWFQPLNPYDVPVELFKLEDENFSITDPKKLEKLYCYAVSAKRYVLFNIDEERNPVVRRASGHGLGALRKPYDDKPDHPGIPKPPRGFPKPQVKLKGVARWQHDYWYRVAKLAIEGRDNEGSGADHPIFNRPAAYSYQATKPAMLGWFDSYNEGKPYEEQVRPFGFLLSFQPAPLFDLTNDRPRGKKPFRPTAPYDGNIEKALAHSFDRNDPGRHEPLARSNLRTYRELLADYHMHDEAKFRNARGSERGETLRRHVFVGPADLHYIGKESNDWEAQFYLGADDDAQQEYGPIPIAVAELMGQLRAADEKYGRRQLARAAGISARYLSAIINGAATNPSSRTLAKFKRGMARLDTATRERDAQEQEALLWLREQCEHGLIGEMAKRLGHDSKNLAKVLKSQRAPNASLLEKIAAIRDRQTKDAT